MEAMNSVIIEAAKVDDLKLKYSRLDEDEIDMLNDRDPSPTKKYLPWAVEQLAKGSPPVELAREIERFHKNLPRVTNKDIGSYKTLDALREAVDAALPKAEAVKKAEDKAKAKEQSEVVIDDVWGDQRFFVLHPKSMVASCHYGKGTRWCISADEENWFDYYSKENKFFYFLIDRKAEQKSEWSKICFVIQKDNPSWLHVWNAKDNRIKEEDVAKNLWPDREGGEAKVMEIVNKIGEHADSQPDTVQYTEAQKKMSAALYAAAKLMAEAVGLMK